VPKLGAQIKHAFQWYQKKTMPKHRIIAHSFLTQHVRQPKEYTTGITRIFINPQQA